ncbi:MAG: YbhB/YbcL family Raf kinase inhibitor-like protein [Actinomycetota bacterium]|nr:YbhB/YbcL family Raf kinase inhibitor-like protein [Actinomycetota bacterium]
MRGSLLVVLLAVSACDGEAAPPPPDAGDSPAPTSSPPADAFTLESPAFAPGGPIPATHTCDAASPRPPPLSWDGVPEGTSELALLMEDPDAPGGTYVHWTAWGLRPTLAGLEATMPPGAQEGTNSADVVGYVGPCPPDGEHRYVFSLFALADGLPLEEGSSIEEFETAVAKVTIAQAQLTGVYQR